MDSFSEGYTGESNLHPDLRVQSVISEAPGRRALGHESKARAGRPSHLVRADPGYSLCHRTLKSSQSVPPLVWLGYGDLQGGPHPALGLGC